MKRRQPRGIWRLSTKGAKPKKAIAKKEAEVSNSKAQCKGQLISYMAN